MNVDRDRTTVVGVFQDRESLNQAVEDLKAAGFTNDQIGVMVHPGQDDPTGATFAPGESASGEGAATGAVTGGMIGGVLGAVAVGLIPGIGPVLAGGALIGILGGAAVGATAGGVLGGLAGLGIPEEEAQYYSGEFQAGRHLVTVRANGGYEEAREILSRRGAYDIQTRGEPVMDMESGGGGRAPFVRDTGDGGQDGISNEAEPEVADLDLGSGMTSGGATAGGTFVHRTESGEPVVIKPEDDRDRAA